MDSREPVFRSLAIIEERIREKLTVQSLAQSIHFSKYHYQRLFREAVGESVMRYVTRRRLSLAAGELVKTGDSVLEIALRYGYDSHEGFTRSFRAYMGVSPLQYRKSRSLLLPDKTPKERCGMYGKAADAIMEELNGLITKAEETARYLREQSGAQQETAAYGPFWESYAARAQELAQQLTEPLERVSGLSQHPDGISARFLLIRTMEDAAFQLSAAAFQAGLLTARAKPEHREALLPLCRRYEALAESARLGVGRIAEFFSELAALIFQDMRQEASRRLKAAAAAGEAAAWALCAGPALPYGYIAQELQAIADELSATPPEQMSTAQLEDGLFRLDIVWMAAETDILRAPADRPLFAGIADFRERLHEALEFFRNLPDDAIRQGEAPAPCVAQGKRYSDLAFQLHILLFYLRGEMQKLGSRRLDEECFAALNGACARLDEAIRFCYGIPDGQTDAQEVEKSLKTACEAVGEVSARLGVYGAALQFIAQEIDRARLAVCGEGV